ncbi:hypothetical protein BJP40_30245 [Streptomyces sp. CC53]|uniref:DUF4253 domain-containing protein n=1 Tax=unclassified Streptomyces TaxID=2593676 RepID=UPI0008DDF712|nr:MULTISPECIES: DUF4253 domain-containing protein [unclassified Streptomyces]OII61919.1 hypothetical protein BJP40_30245 [Streptomyces sp. CC53]
MVINPNALDLDLPPGTVHVQPSYWYADEPAAPEIWSRLLTAREATGLQPVLLTEKQFPPTDLSGDADDHDPAATLSALWGHVQETGREEPWAGPAAPGTRTADPDDRAALLADELLTDDKYFTGARAALVPARSSADIVTALGWSGACNFTEAARLASVLRSWEDRFGIRVVGLGPDIMSVSVAAPPRTRGHALAVAREHFAFCPDIVSQGVGSIEEYAEEDVLNRTDWWFWWD